MSGPNPLQSGGEVGGNRFTLVRPLGRGGMGEVWLAQDERLAEPVALKFLPPEVRADASALDDLRRETAKSHKLTHPNIVRIHDFHEPEDEAAFISMEYVEGWTLTAVRVEQPSRVLSWEYLRPLVEQLCAALDYAHGEHVIHRDLKPGNIMVDNRGRLKLADFGIAATVSDSVSRVSNRHATSGTLPYMSPQQLAGKRPSAADDIYALGATLYELLTSKPPFYTGDITHQVLHELPEPPDERLAGLSIANDIPPDVSAIIMACMGKDPAQRPQSARAVAEWIGLEAVSKPSVESVAEALSAQSDAGEAAADGSSPRAPTEAASRRRAAVVGGMAGALLFAGAVLWHAYRHGSDEIAAGSLVEGAGAAADVSVRGARPSGSLPNASKAGMSSAPANHEAASGGQTAGHAQSVLPVWKGLVLHFSFDQPLINDVVHDESGMGNDGQVVGAHWRPDGRTGGACFFAAQNSYILIKNRPSLNPPQLSLAAWLKTSCGGETWRRIFDKCWSDGFALSVGGGFVPNQHHHGKLALEINNPRVVGRAGGEVDSDNPINDGQWHHVVATYDGQEERCYVDAQLQRQINRWRGPAPTNSFDLTLGINLANPNPRFGEINASLDGLLDEVMMFNRALSSDEVRQLYEMAGPVTGAAAPAAAQSKKPASPVGEAVVYKTVEGRGLNLYLLKPADWKASDRRPAIVLFHGGGWVGGSPSALAPQGQYLASRGMVCALVEYRLLSRDSSDPPVVCIRDAKSAMRWVRGHAHDLGIDPNRIAASGGSAGGHLAAFVGLANGFDDPQDDLAVSPRANALVLLNPVFDNGPEHGWGTERVGARYKEFSPAHNITTGAPPTLVLVGNQDKLIPLSVVERFKTNMSKAGARCETRVYDGQGHGFFNREPWLTRTLIETDKFLGSLGWLQGPPALKAP